MVGCEEPPTREQIDAKRLFSDFTVFSGEGSGNGYETSYQVSRAEWSHQDQGRLVQMIIRKEPPGLYRILLRGIG